MISGLQRNVHGEKLSTRLGEPKRVSSRSIWLDKFVLKQKKKQNARKKNARAASPMGSITVQAMNYHCLSSSCKVGGSGDEYDAR